MGYFSALIKLLDKEPIVLSEILIIAYSESKYFMPLFMNIDRQMLEA